MAANLHGWRLEQGIHLLKRFWFKLDRGEGYGVTAHSRQDAEQLLSTFGYPADSQRIVGVIEGVSIASLDEDRVLPSIGPVAVRGVWFPCHNL